MTALHLVVLGIESTTFSNSAEVVTRNYELMIASIRLVLLPGCFCITRLFSRDHKFSIGLMYGLFPGQVSSWTLCCWKLEPSGADTSCVAWCSILLEYEVATISPNRSRAEGSIFGSSTSLMYLVPAGIYIPLQHLNPTNSFSGYAPPYHHAEGMLRGGC